MRFRRLRARTRAMFDLLDESVYYDRPIALRNPIVFYEGHLPAFAVNTLLKKALGEPGIDERLEVIFARGIDPDTEAMAVARGNPAWPSRADVAGYAAEADRRLEAAIASAELHGDHPMLHDAQALWAILEHEEMHQETLAYMWHELPYEKKQKPSGYMTLVNSQLPTPDSRRDAGGSEQALGVGSWKSGVDRSQVIIPQGNALLGTSGDRFGWDNEQPAHELHVPAFAIDRDDVTNAAFMEFVEAGGYSDARYWRAEDWAWIEGGRIEHPHFWRREGGRWYWRGMFELVPLPESWPVYVTWAEAAAFARWRGLRLPTEAEFHRAAYGDAASLDRPEDTTDVRLQPDTTGRQPAGNYDFTRWDPVPVGSYPEGTSAFGVRDLVGNGWKWTATVFGPFAGFSTLASYPEYSADFFDGDHFVLKGASPVTARELVRPGFRNWFRPRYPYVYATFRCATNSC